MELITFKNGLTRGQFKEVIRWILLEKGGFVREEKIVRKSMET